MPGTSSRARSRSGSKATTVAVARLPSVRTTSVAVFPATTWALVATSSSADHEPAALLEPSAGLALDPDGRGRHPVGHRAGDAGAGRGVAEVRSRTEGVEDVREAVVADELTQGGERVRRRGEDGVDGAGDAGVPGEVGGPARHVGHGRQGQPEQHQHPDDTGDRAHGLVHRAGGAVGDRHPEPAPDQEPQGLAEEPAADQEGDHREERLGLAGGLQPVQGRGQDPGGEVDAADHADPGGGPGHEAEAPRRHTRRQGRDEDEDVEDVHRRRVSPALGRG